MATSNRGFKRMLDRAIVLGEPLDQMLNAECKYPFQLEVPDIASGPGGLLRPTPYSPGTGNIVIRGRAGSGKSTLALQILCEAVRRNNNTYGAYISLEESQAGIFEKAIDYQWSPYVWPLNRTFPVEAAATVEQLAGDLKSILEHPMLCQALGILTNPRRSSDDRDEWYEDSSVSRDLSRCPYDSKDNRPCSFRRRCYTAEEDWPKVHSHDEDDKEFVKSPGIVILPKLLPRPFEQGSHPSEQEDLFWRRYRQLDNLLSAAKHLRSRENYDLALVCIDSLNVLGVGELTRDHLSALFDLFKRRQMLGVFAVEENESGVFAGDSPIDSDTIDFLADMVINLTTSEEEGYWLRHFQISKSRYQKHVLGRHPFKISGTSAEALPSAEGKGNSYRTSNDGADPEHETEQAARPILKAIDELRKTKRWAERKSIYGEWDRGKECRRRFPMETGLHIFPSIHTIVSASDRLAKDPHTHVPERRIWSSENLQKLIRLQAGSGPQVFTVAGPATSGKSLVAGNFLLEGLRWGEDVLLVRLGERPEFTASGSWSPQDASKPIPPKLDRYWSSSLSEVRPDELKPESKDKPDVNEPSEDRAEGVRKGTLRIDEAQCPNQIHLLRAMLSVFDPQKIQYAIHEFDKEFLDQRIKLRDQNEHRRSRSPLLLEIAMKSGALLPEEFIDVVRVIYRWGRHFRGRAGFDIRRVALLDVSAIGVGYPLLRQSTTAADLALSALVHVLRCRGTDFLMTAQTGGIAESENLAKKAISLADHVIWCGHCDVFGDRYITVSGPGLIESDMIRGKNPESVPGVLRLRESAKKVQYFEIDFETLQGLVGFSSGNIRRPGVALQLFEEGTLQKRYNSQVGRLVEFAMGSVPAVSASDSGSSRLSQRGKDVSIPTLNVAHSDAPTVIVDTFDSFNAAPFHDSLGLLKGAPLHNTVLRTVDEFAVKGVLNSDDANLGGERLLCGELSYRPLYAHLYYRNVLLIACDKKTSERLRSQRKRLISFWEEATRLVTQEDVALLCDHRAPETLACLAMDGIQSIWPDWGREDLMKGRPEPSKKQTLEKYLQLMNQILPCSTLFLNPNVPSRLSQASRNLVEDHSYRIARNANALKEALAQGAPAALDVDSFGTTLKTLSSKLLKNVNLRQAYPRYMVLCWYSQLRELISLHQNDEAVESNKVRNMVKDMQVLGLPGGGFAGDWYITVPSGSVSETLGARIKTALLGPQEDLKRFIDGVGLPAWPREDSLFFGASFGDVLESAVWCNGDLEQRERIIKDINNLLKVVAPKQTQSADLMAYLEQSKAVSNRRRLKLILKKICTGLECMDKKGQPASSPRLLPALEELLANGTRFLSAVRRYNELKEAARANRESLMAWPGGSVPLTDVLEIHRHANRRSQLSGYQEIRSELFALLRHWQSKQKDPRGLESRNSVDHVIELARIAYVGRPCWRSRVTC
jgi:KaiC/GvpD/RAD55 family RecA-like ATPase